MPPLRLILFAGLLVACGRDDGTSSHRRPPSEETPTTQPSSWQPRGAEPWLSEADVPGLDGRQASAWLFSDEELPTFELEVDDIGMDALRADPDRWVEGALIYGGIRYEPVGVRVKGENSFQPIDAKPSLKVDLNRYADLSLLGLRGLTFNNMDDDPSMIHERLAYRLYRELGVPASRCTHAWIRLNGRDLGLYEHVEDVDRFMIGAWHDDSGTMVELHDVDFEPGFSPYDFTIDFGTSAIANLQGTIDALQEPDPDLALAALEDHMSVDSFVDYFAVSMVLAQYDAYPYSNPGDDAHVYDDPASGVLVWLPHGVDETLWNAAPDPFVGPGGVNGEVGKACLASASCTAQLQARVAATLDVMEAIDLHGYAQTVIDQVAPLVVQDTNKAYTDDTVAAEQAVVLDFLVDRRADIVLP